MSWQHHKEAGSAHAAEAIDYNFVSTSVTCSRIVATCLSRSLCSQLAGLCTLSRRSCCCISVAKLEWSTIICGCACILCRWVFAKLLVELSVQLCIKLIQQATAH